MKTQHMNQEESASSYASLESFRPLSLSDFHLEPKTISNTSKNGATLDASSFPISPSRDASFYNSAMFDPLPESLSAYQFPSLSFSGPSSRRESMNLGNGGLSRTESYVSFTVSSDEEDENCFKIEEQKRLASRPPSRASQASGNKVSMLREQMEQKLKLGEGSSFTPTVSNCSRTSNIKENLATNIAGKSAIQNPPVNAQGRYSQGLEYDEFIRSRMTASEPVNKRVQPLYPKLDRPPTYRTAVASLSPKEETKIVEEKPISTVNTPIQSTNTSSSQFPPSASAPLPTPVQPSQPTQSVQSYPSVQSVHSDTSNTQPFQQIYRVDTPPSLSNSVQSVQTAYPQQVAQQSTQQYNPSHYHPHQHECDCQHNRCPVCHVHLSSFASNMDINRHLDECLHRNNTFQYPSPTVVVYAPPTASVAVLNAIPTHMQAPTLPYSNGHVMVQTAPLLPPKPYANAQPQPQLQQGRIAPVPTTDHQKPKKNMMQSVKDMLSSALAEVDVITSDGKTRWSSFRINEPLLAEFPCKAITAEGPVRGYLLISTGHICFVSTYLNNTKKVARAVIPFQSVLGMRQAFKASGNNVVNPMTQSAFNNGIQPNAIQLVTPDRMVHQFYNLRWNYHQACNVAYHAWQASKLYDRQQ